MQDRPEAPELMEAVAAYLFGELRPEVPPQERFRVLVAANACAVVAREIRAGAAHDRADLELFARLLGRVPGSAEDGDPSAEARAAAGELAAAIRSGSSDDDLDAVIDALAEHVRRKLEVARPGYAGSDDD